MDSEQNQTKEILGFTTESLMVWVGFALGILGIYFLSLADQSNALFYTILAEIFLLISVSMVAVGVYRDFRKPHLRIFHWIGNIMVLLLWLILLAFLLIVSYSFIS